MSRCAPQREPADCSCFTKQNLLAIVSVWNAYYSNEPDKHINAKSYLPKCDIWGRINERILENGECNNEQCWMKLKQLAQFAHNHKEHEYFRPIAPGEWFNGAKLLGSDDTNRWLSSTDISKVMDQYDGKKYKFLFLGTVPIDFATSRTFDEDSCIALDWGPLHKTKYLCDINIQDMKSQNIEQFGVVFNTADHTSSGQHWIALYCSIRKKKIVYFDSYGYSPPPEVETFITKIQSKSRDKFKVVLNTKRHQQEYSECGMYAVHFLINMLSGVSWTKFNKALIPDSQMLKKRSEYFNRY